MDLLLLMQTEMDRLRLRDNIERTFAHRATHPLPHDLPSPPDSWRARFQELATECDLDVEMESAVITVARYARYRLWNFHSYVVCYVWQQRPFQIIAVVHGARDLAASSL